MSDLAEMTFDENQKTNQKFSISAGDVDFQKESLVILASLGTTKEYLGVEMSFEKIHKLPDKEVEKFFNRYQKVAGQKMANGLVDSAISTATKVISCFLPIDDTEELCYDLQNDELVKRELSNIAGLLVVRGGRLVALGSALFQVVRHIKFNRDSDSGSDRDSEAVAKLRSGDSGAGESQTARLAFVVEKQNINENRRPRRKQNLSWERNVGSDKKMKYTYFIFEVFDQEKRSFFENNSRFVYCFCVNIMRMRTNDIDSNSFCVNIMIERKQLPEIDFVIASLRQKTFESYLNLFFMLV